MTTTPWIFNRCRCINVVDGDTVDLEIDLGFLVATRVRGAEIEPYESEELSDEDQDQ